MATIWAERDLMRDAISNNFDPRKALVDDYMTTELVSAPYRDTVFNLMDKCIGRRIRHLLVTDEH